MRWTAKNRDGVPRSGDTLNRPELTPQSCYTLLRDLGHTDIRIVGADGQVVVDDVKDVYPPGFERDLGDPVSRRRRRRAAGVPPDAGRRPSDTPIHGPADTPIHGPADTPIDPPAARRRRGTPPPIAPSEKHSNVTDPGLRRALDEDDLAEDRGMHGDERRTCGNCQTWATDAHLNSDQHQALWRSGYDPADFDQYGNRRCEHGCGTDDTCSICDNENIAPDTAAERVRKFYDAHPDLARRLADPDDDEAEAYQQIEGVRPDLQQQRRDEHAERLARAAARLGEDAERFEWGGEDAHPARAYAKRVAAAKVTEYAEKVRDGEQVPGIRDERDLDLIADAANMSGILMKPRREDPGHDRDRAERLARLADAGILVLVEDPGQIPFYALAGYEPSQYNRDLTKLTDTELAQMHKDAPTLNRGWRSPDIESEMALRQNDPNRGYHPDPAACDHSVWSHLVAVDPAGEHGTCVRCNNPVSRPLSPDPSHDPTPWTAGEPRFQPGDRVWHRQLKAFGTFEGHDPYDKTTSEVLFDDDNLGGRRITTAQLVPASHAPAGALS